MASWSDVSRPRAITITTITIVRSTNTTITTPMSTDDSAAQGDSVSLDWRTRLRELMAASFGKSFWSFVAVAVMAGAACYYLRGHDAFFEGWYHDLAMLADTVPRVVAAVGIAGMVYVLLPREKLAALIGEGSGLKGLFIAAGGGIITPGGPSSAYPLLALLAAGGAHRGPLVAYMTGWSMLGVQRILMWDVPLMGADFSLTRFLISLPLPIIAGLIASKIPFSMRLADSPADKGGMK